MSEDDLLDWQVPQADIQTLYAAKNKNGAVYTFLKLPLSQNNVVTTYGKNLGYKGSYVNYYIANTKVLVPNYNDPNDAVANRLIQSIYPNRTVIGIDVRNLYANGGNGSLRYSTATTIKNLLFDMVFLIMLNRNGY